MFYYIIFHRTILYHICYIKLLNHIVFYRFVLLCCNALLYYIILYHIVLYHIISYYIISISYSVITIIITIIFVEDCFGPHLPFLQNSRFLGL